MLNFFKITSNIIGVVIVIIAAILLLSAYLTSFIETDKPWVLASGLVMPIIYFVNIVILLFLILKGRFIFAILPLAVLLLTFNTTTSMYGINVFKRYDNSKSKIKVMTFNVHGFRDEHYISSFDSIINDIDTVNADILCFQEFHINKRLTLDSIKSHIPKYKYVHLHISDSTNAIPTIGGGTAIFSRYPLLNQINFDFEDSGNSLQVSNVVISGDTLTIINAHLQSYRISIPETNLLRNIKDSLSLLKDTSIYSKKIMPIYDKIVNNNHKRKEQTDKMSEFINNSKYPVIVCGDFNSVPSSYTYRIFTSNCGLQDPFTQFGIGYEGTYKNYFGNLFRIDYILHSEEYKSVSFDVPQQNFSDHNPVVVELTKNK